MTGFDAAADLTTANKRFQRPALCAALPIPLQIFSFPVPTKGCFPLPRKIEGSWETIAIAPEETRPRCQRSRRQPTSYLTNSLKMSWSNGTPSRAQAHLTSSTKSIPE